jgi:hypothetical protein
MATIAKVWRARMKYLRTLPSSTVSFNPTLNPTLNPTNSMISRLTLIALACAKVAQAHRANPPSEHLYPIPSHCQGSRFAPEPLTRPDLLARRADRLEAAISADLSRAVSPFALVLVNS